MKRTFLVLALCLGLVCTGGAAWGSGSKAVTPPAGSALRQAILAPLRAYLRENLKVEAVFVVRWLKVKDGWAWIETEPRSKDGKNVYEPLFALLAKQEGAWRIVDIPPMEEDSPPIDGAYFRKLMENHPGLPPEIFPWEK
jgi:hypothetical protein